jgi:Winged Helix-turn-helix domain
MRRPRLRSHLWVEVIDPSHALILSDIEYWTFGGPVYPRLLPLLDGTRTTADLVDQLKHHANVAEVLAALLILERSGYLADGVELAAKPITRISLVSFGLPQHTEPAVRMLEMLGSPSMTTAI